MNQRRQVEVRGTPVHLVTGGRGPALLYLHGAGGAGRWLDFQERLAERFTVHFPSHPGHGGSPAAEWIEHISDLAFHYLDLLDDLGVERAHVVGASFGGWIRVFADELRAGIVCSGMNAGTHEATLEMMEMFAREVMPHFRDDAHVDETAGVDR